jgi:hypothetical protein
MANPQKVQDLGMGDGRRETAYHRGDGSEASTATRRGAAAGGGGAGASRTRGGGTREML